MFYIKLNTMDVINKLVRICDRYKETMDIDMLYGRYVVDAASLLGVMSLMGNVVEIKPNTNDPELAKKLFEELELIKTTLG